MAGRIPENWLNDLFEKTDIVQIVSQYVHLKKDGKRYWGLCPFHNEKTPSFSVSSDLNLYYCFGCKAGGNMIQFVMEMEHLSFTDAAIFIGEKFNLPPPEMREDPSYEKTRSLRERLYQANKEAARFYHATLWTDAGQKALQYLYGRGLTDGVIRKFGLGASPDKWDGLLNHMTELGYTKEELISAGLVIENENNTHDMFRSRVMYPIIDAKDHVLGFGGRILGDGKPKYMNTADTVIYNKRHHIYAGNLIKKERNLKRILLVEGYMDVIALTQMGIHGAAATLGTSLTPEQAHLMHRFAPEVWVAYDGDEPGQHAIEKAIPIFDKEEMPLRVLHIPDALDPDEYVRQRGVSAFESLKPVSSVRFLIDRVILRHDMSDTDEKTECAKECAVILKRVKSPIELETYMEYLALRTGFSKDVLYAQLGVTKPETVSAKHFANASVSVIRKDRNNDKNQDNEKAQQTLLALMVRSTLPEGLIKPEYFSSALYRFCAEKLLKGELPGRIIDDLEGPEEISQASAAFSMAGDLDTDNTAEVAQDCINKIRIYQLETQIETLKKEMSICENSKRLELLNQIKLLSSDLNLAKNNARHGM